MTSPAINAATWRSSIEGLISTHVADPFFSRQMVTIGRCFNLDLHTISAT